MKSRKLAPKIALVFVNNEIVMKAVKSALEKRGYEVRYDIESCAGAKLGVIGAYFAYLGIVKQLLDLNPALPVILIENNELKLDEISGSSKELYDVIKIENHDEREISRKIGQWFSQENGRRLEKGA